jgi:methionyl-tRNA formyltransferase
MASSLPIRIIVVGTGDFALLMFELLCETSEGTGAHHQVLALLTQPDRPQGRNQELIPSRIKQRALHLGIPVLQPENVNDASSLERIRQLAPDLLVTAAYGQILSPELLSIPRLGGINLHGSILPAYRGAAPVARAIQNNETETGVTVIMMTPRIDAGGVIALAQTPIDPDETAGELEARLAAIGAPLIVSCIAPLAAGETRIIPQDRSKVTRAPKLKKEDGLVDWTRSALAIHNLVRAMQPWPLASTTWTPGDPSTSEGLRLILHKTRPLTSSFHDPAPQGSVVHAEGDRLIVAAGEGILQLLIVQLPGKKPMPAADFLRGHRVRPGDLMKS